MPTEATVAHVLVSKYADHLPLSRQAQIYSRQGIDLDRSTLAAWHCRALEPLLPILIEAPTDEKARAKWLEPLRGAIEDDGVYHLAPIADRFGQIVARPTLMNTLPRSDDNPVEMIVNRR